MTKVRRPVALPAAKRSTDLLRTSAVVEAMTASILATSAPGVATPLRRAGPMATLVSMPLRLRRAIGTFVAVVAAAAVVVPAAPLASAVAQDSPRAVSLQAESTRSAERAEVGFGRWRDLFIGMTIRQARRTGKIERVDTCGPWVLKERWARLANVVFYSSDHRLHSVAVFGRGERTAVGAGIGTTLRQLRDLYGDLSSVRHWGPDDDGIDYVFVRREAGTITFQFRYGRDAGPGAHVQDMVVTARRPAIFYEGC